MSNNKTPWQDGREEFERANEETRQKERSWGECADGETKKNPSFVKYENLLTKEQLEKLKEILKRKS